MEKITLLPEQQRKFEMAIKIGIAKELHRGNMLTDSQLSMILSDLQSQDAPVYDNHIEQAG